MTGLFGAVGLARTAQRHLRTARDLEARWSALAPEQQDAVREQLGALRTTAGEVQFKLSYGVRGFVHEFKAAKDGVEPGPIDEGRPLGESVKDLDRAIRAMRRAIEAPPAPDPPAS